MAEARKIQIMLIGHPTSVRTLQSRRHRAFTYRFVVLLVMFAHASLATPSEARHKEERHTAGKPVSGWVCNAYGLAGGWQTVTGSPSRTKAAALASVLKDCQRSHFACRSSGCWPR